MKLGLRWCVLLLGIAALVGCGKATQSTVPNDRIDPNAEPYVIGAIFSITGDASSLGIPQRDTAKMIEGMVNASGGIDGHPIEIHIEDDTGENAAAVTSFRRLSSDPKVLAIVGPSRTGTTLALAPELEKAKIPVISCASGLEIVEPVKPWLFNTAPLDKRAVERIIDYLKPKKITRAAIICDNSPYGKSGQRELKTLLPAAGITIVASEEYGPKDAAMETQLTKIKGKKPQTVICWGTPPGPGLIAKKMRQLAMIVPLICGSGVANEKFIQAAGEAANGVVLPAARLIVRDQIPQDNPQKVVLDEYAAKFQEMYKMQPDHFGGHAWDAIQLILKALPETGPDRAKLRDKLEQTQGFVGTDGIFNYSATDHNGLSKDAFVMVTIEGGKWKLLE
jgi:branched-chain amino acid transport system substrate-binding protein